MATDGADPDETEVDEGGDVTIPPAIRSRLDIEEGGELRWEVDDDGTLSVEVVHRRHGTFDDFEAVPMGGDGRETHDGGCVASR